MNSKAIKRQLLAAIAMVLVAAIALGSSTYAWFVASGTVEAKGMKVKAQSDGNLVIRYKYSGNWGTSATAGVETARSLQPVSTVDLATWVKAQAANPMDELANLDTAEPVSLEYGNDQDDSDQTASCFNNNHALIKYFQIASASKDDAPSGLKVDKIIVNGTDAAPISFDKNMSTALRIGVKTTYTGSDNKPASSTFIFAPVDDNNKNQPTKTYHYLKAVDDKYFYSDDATQFGDDVDTFTVADYTTAELVPSGTPITNSNNPVKVYIYIWFEGEDANLYSSNYEAEDLNVTLKFTSIPKTTNQGTSGNEGQGV